MHKKVDLDKIDAMTVLLEQQPGILFWALRDGPPEQEIRKVRNQLKYYVLNLPHNKSQSPAAWWNFEDDVISLFNVMHRYTQSMCNLGFLGFYLAYDKNVRTTVFADVLCSLSYLLTCFPINFY